ncbi:uncharacterized protein FFB20_03077 [Fusarium fujikuroi]|nr:uncharacterized protein FFB20_03077 [Fusarium fujikuroi]SCO17069.1 uncharacterized protein FFE2_13710 [Fusarium fujikuroi]SCO24166.1 uncharacterized protein FFC1_14982 [Fusarium fujikuroi]VTT69271.1 unnamed protein product [Fusarium fujikuroi]
MNPKYLLFLPLGLVCANPLEVRGKNNGCPSANGGCSGTCIHTGNGDFCRTQSKDATYDFPCGRIFNGNGLSPTDCGGKSGASCTVYGDAETFCPYWA